MGLLDDTKVKALLVGFLLSLAVLVATASLGLVAVLSALADPTGFLPFVLLNAAAPYLVASMLVGLVSFLLFVALSVAAVRRASVPRDERLAELARTVERVSPQARRVDLAERFEPTAEERIEQLKREYVAGEITELEYERRLQDLLREADRGDQRGARLDSEGGRNRGGPRGDDIRDDRARGEQGRDDREREFER